MPASPRRARLSRAARYEQLLDAAASLVADHGPERLTMEAVAAASGVDKALPYRHFANRDALLLALYERSLAAFDARVAAAVATAGSLEQELRAILELWLDDLEAGGVVSRVQRLEAAAGPLARRRRRRLTASARYLADRIRAHRAIPPQRARIAAGVLMAGSVGLLASWRETGVSRRTAVDVFVRMALGAIDRLAASPGRGGRR